MHSERSKHQEYSYASKTYFTSLVTTEIRAAGDATERASGKTAAF